jgi:hypothetical protein
MGANCYESRKHAVIGVTFPPISGMGDVMEG